MFTLSTEMNGFTLQADFPLDVPWSELYPEHQRLIVDGEKKFLGVRGFFRYLERKKYKLHVRVFLSRYRGYSLCSASGGASQCCGAVSLYNVSREICCILPLTGEESW